MGAHFASPRAVILMYHSVVEDPAETATTIRISQSRASFEWQISRLAKRFKPVSFDEVVGFVANGRPLPKGAVAVTFDDGFADNYEVALPILQRYGIPAMFYIMVNAVDSGVPPWYCRLTYVFHSTVLSTWTHPTSSKIFQLGDPAERTAALSAAWDLGAALSGEAQDRFMSEVQNVLQVAPLSAGSKLMMDWSQVRALKKSGHLIGAHTLSHPNLAHVPVQEARSEIQGCKQKLEQELGEAVPHFSYPHPALNPEWSPQTLELTRQAGFQSAVLTKAGAVQPGHDPLALMRIPGDEDSGSWLWQLERAFAGF